MSKEKRWKEDGEESECRRQEEREKKERENSRERRHEEEKSGKDSREGRKSWSQLLASAAVSPPLQFQLAWFPMMQSGPYYHKFLILPVMQMLLPTLIPLVGNVQGEETLKMRTDAANPPNIKCMATKRDGRSFDDQA
uniref:Uncharacterized protein n=1 Tax=Romanomermis culicivorax TaxID=13658 RepID=A0A915LAR7_ROMCU